MMSFPKLLLAAALCLGAAVEAMAIRAYPRTVVVRQPDGTTISVRIHGDERMHYTATTDGLMLARDQQGFLRYVDYDLATGRQTLSAFRASNVDQRTAEEKRFIGSLNSARSVAADMMARGRFAQKGHLRTLNLRRANIATAKQRAATRGETQFLVILVNFADHAFTFGRSDFDAWLNERGYSANGATGSVQDYYRDNSMGQFVPNFTVVGPYTLSQNQAYYAGNDLSTGSDTNPYDMVVEACQLAKADRPDLDFSQFDNDGDGFIDNLYVIYAGYSEASTAEDDDMWPHGGHLSTVSKTIEIDGVTIDDYSCSQELVGSPETTDTPSMDGIGTFTHEFGHVLGLKDMYDTDSYTNGVANDPGHYCLYANGSYNNSSRTPAALMAFERLQMGWAVEGRDIVAINGPEDITLDNITTNTARYINCQPDRPDSLGYEWLVIENRQQTGWDTYIPGHGLLIYHLDYTSDMVSERWSVNGPNNYASHRCMYIKAADGTDDDASRYGDTWPGTTANNAFTDYTTPNALNWAGQPTGIPLTNIIEHDGLVSFQACGGATEWQFVKTNKPVGVSDSTATFSATATLHGATIAKAGFCWGATKQPTLADSHIEAEPTADFVATATELLPGRRYYVRAYALTTAGDTIYGSPIQFTTECSRVEAPFVAAFDSWTDYRPDCWEIVDRNGDATTWDFDEQTQGVVYQYDYWNNADDWLILKRRIHVPDNGALFFQRGISGTTAVEKLEIWVSEASSDIENFYLLERRSFADHFDEQYIEEVDLSRLAGKDIYIAFRCTSEKAQNMLWIWAIAVTEKLATPQITAFRPSTDEQLQLEWTPVDGARYYYVYFGKEQDAMNEVTVFCPEDYFERITGRTDISVGRVDFTGDGSVETRTFDDGIENLIFLTTTSGPFGTSTLRVEATRDGSTWEPIGPTVRLTEYDNEGQECDYGQYVAGQGYKRLRFSFTHGGRNGSMRYITLTYLDGHVVNSLAEGVAYDTSVAINSTYQGEFLDSTFVAWVAAGDGLFFYDESPTARYNHEEYVTSIAPQRIDGTPIDLRISRGQMELSGLERGNRVTVTSASGAVVYSAEATDDSILIPTAAHTGVVVVRVSTKSGTFTTKAIAI